MPPAESSPRIEVEVGDPRSFLRPADRARLAAVVRRVLEAEGRPRAEVSVAVVDDAEIRAVNRAHLDHDWPTDVISFVLSDEGDETLSAELVVSHETAARMAARDGVDAWTELVLYVIHGTLHLCGHDDLTEEGAAGMRRREGEILAGLGLSHPFSPFPRGTPHPNPPPQGGRGLSGPSPLAGEGRVGGGPAESLSSPPLEEAAPWPN